MEDGLTFVQKQHARVPSYASAIALGTALRHTNQLAAAVDAFRAASKLDLKAADARLDLGDSLLALGRLEDAAEAFKTALALAPGNNWALASLNFLDALKGDAEAEKRLQTAAHLEPAGRGSALYGRLFPFTHQLCWPNSGLVNLVLEAIGRGTSLKTIMLSSIEAPSAVLALRWTERQLGWPRSEIQLTLSGPADPRKPIEPVNDPLWTYDRPGNDDIAAEATAALPPPSVEVSTVVGRLAARTFDLDLWSAEARTLASGWAFGARSLLSAIAHPQPVGDLPSWAAIFRSQVAAALLLAFLVDESERQAALRSLLYGPVDWSTSAGIVALTAVARTDRTRAAASVRLMMDLLLRETMPIRYQCIHKVVVPCLLALSGLPASLRAELIRLRRSIHVAPTW
jgi:tetratricopeptide (TPR) repeat protein